MKKTSFKLKDIKVKSFTTFSNQSAEAIKGGLAAKTRGKKCPVKDPIATQDPGCNGLTKEDSCTCPLTVQGLGC